MPRGEGQACRKPGHDLRAVRCDGATYCVTCKRENDARSNLRASWRRQYRNYLRAVETIGVEEVHFRLREAGVPIRRQ